MQFEDPVSWALIFVFVIGYLLISLERVIGINKATSALLMGVVAWVIEFSNSKITHHENVHYFGDHLSNIAQVIIFLIGVLVIVEVINSHDGFRIIKNVFKSHSKNKILWGVGLTTFFFASVLGSLSMTIVMLALLAKMVPLQEDRLVLGCGIVIAANAGGAFSPLGDITTTMLWIGGQLTSTEMVYQLFLPSFLCLAFAFLLLQRGLKEKFIPALEDERESGPASPHSKAILLLGMGAILFVPICKELIGLPPFMGILLGLSVVWLVTDLLHAAHEDREHLTIPKLFNRLDFSDPLFFLGVLLAINALNTAGVLAALAGELTSLVSSPLGIAAGTGIVSALIDNVPLVSALIGMFPLSSFPQDDHFWQLIAYSAGVGGSILMIGSASGIAFMGMENVSFNQYLKKATLPAFVGFVAGLIVFYFQSSF